MPVFVELTHIDHLTGEIRRLDIDPQTTCLVTIDNEHHHIHEGLAWMISGTATKNNGEVQDFLCVTQNSDWLVHLRPSATGTAQGYIAIYEAPTYNPAGSAYTPVNLNRDDQNATTSTWTSGPTVSVVGTLMMYFQFGDGQTGGGVDAQHEIVLDRNTAYLVRVGSLAAGNAMNWNVLFYEHAMTELHA